MHGPFCYDLFCFMLYFVLPGVWPEQTKSGAIQVVCKPVLIDVVVIPLFPIHHSSSLLFFVCGSVKFCRARCSRLVARKNLTTSVLIPRQTLRHSARSLYFTGSWDLVSSALMDVLDVVHVRCMYSILQIVFGLD